MLSLLCKGMVNQSQLGRGKMLEGRRRHALLSALTFMPYLEGCNEISSLEQRQLADLFDNFCNLGVRSGSSSFG